MGKLTVKEIQKLLKKPGRHGDGDGLWLQVRDAERCSWLFRYVRNGQAREMGLGPLSEVSLAEARDAAQECRRVLREGKDPLEARREHKAAAAAEKAEVFTFRAVAGMFLEAHEAGWRNPKHKAQWRSTLEAYVYPRLGDLPVDAIETDHVLATLKPIWMEVPETASRVRGRIEQILGYAAARGWRKGDNPAQWRGHLAKVLPARGKIARAEHHHALPYEEIAAFVAALRDEEGWAPLALEFAVLTAARTGEALGARWDEIDMPAKRWTVPAARMKAGKEHRVPLSSAALAMLEKARRMRTDDNPYVFPGVKPGKPLSNMAMLMLLRRMNEKADPPNRWRDLRSGDPITVHGFRSTFRDWAGEMTAFPSDVAEAALAHTRGDKVEAAYARRDLYEKRVSLMEAWSRFCVGAGADEGEVAALPQTAYLLSTSPPQR